VGFIAFLQGVPAGNGYYNNYAFGGGRLVKKQEIYGASVGGRKVYYRAGCGHSADIADEIFWSEKEAARNGYYPALCDNVSP
jgi:hypothetical protein